MVTDPDLNQADITAIVLFGSGRPLDPLADCLESISRQEVPVRETLVVLNGVALGNDIRTLCDRYRANTLVLSEDRGCPAGRNAGARVARKTILLFVDDDGRLDARATARVLANLKGAHYVAVAGRIVEPGDDNCLGVCPQPRLEQSPPAPTVVFSGGIFAIRRDVFLRYDGYWANSTRQGEELDLALNLFKDNNAIVYDPGLVLYHPRRHIAFSSSISIATSASGARAFASHFPIPIALAAYAWKLGRHIYWLISNKEPGFARVFAAITTDARLGWSERDPMTYKQAVRFRRLVRDSPNIAATRFSLSRTIMARLRRRPPPVSR